MTGMWGLEGMTNAEIAQMLEDNEAERVRWRREVAKHLRWIKRDNPALMTAYNLTKVLSNDLATGGYEAAHHSGWSDGIFEGKRQQDELFRRMTPEQLLRYFGHIPWTEVETDAVPTLQDAPAGADHAAPVGGGSGVVSDQTDA